MLKDIKCPHCEKSITQSIPFFPFVDTVLCSFCVNHVRLSIGALSFTWMQSFMGISIGIGLICLSIAHFFGKPFLLFPVLPWGEILIITLVVIPGSFLLIGYLTIGMLIGGIIKAINHLNRRT